MVSPRILVTVSRTWTDISTMRDVLEKAYAAHPDAVLVHGDCPRGDRLAAKLWRDLGGTDEPWPANWSRGATHCYNLAVGAGLNVAEPYRQED